MKTIELTCIGCPLGCPLTVTIQDNNEISVAGNTCPKGATYAQKEVTNPTRIVTSTVRVSGGSCAMLNVKTASDVPKDKIFACVNALKEIVVPAPIRIGDVILENVADTGVAIIAARNVD